ncbi:RNA polymerase Rpb3/Rpb11 dimerization domain protein, partial [Ostertagia ostertagi]
MALCAIILQNDQEIASFNRLEDRASIIIRFDGYVRTALQCKLVKDAEDNLMRKLVMSVTRQRYGVAAKATYYSEPSGIMPEIYVDMLDSTLFFWPRRQYLNDRVTAHLEAEATATRSLFRNFLMHGFHWLVYLFSSRTVRDTQCGFKLFTRAAAARVFPVLHVERWAFDVELIYLCELWMIPIVEISVTWHEVEGSKIVPVISWLQMGRDLILIWFRYRFGIWTDTMGGKRVARTKSEPMDAESYHVNEIKMEEERVLNVQVVNDLEDGMSLDFDLINVEAPIANALRRVLLAEVPTMAIEKIYLYQNTSVIQDEVLCHRIGLLPLKVDPRKFLMPTEKVIGINEHGVDCEEEPEPDPTRNVVFNINVTCTRNRNAPTTATEPHQLYHQSSIYSKRRLSGFHVEQQFADDPPRIVHDDILVAKLRPGQQIEANCHAVKGIGRDHAKFSPVATATYRLLPTIRLLGEVRGEAAVRLQESFSEGVKSSRWLLTLDEILVAGNVFRHDDLAPLVELGRKKDHFIFSVESTGALKSAELVVEACKISKPVADAVLRYGKDHPASDFVQQLVLFTYSLGVFWGYYIYTKVTTPETLKVCEFEEFREESEKVIGDLQLRVEQLEAALKNRGIKIPVISPPAVDNKDTHSTSQTNKEETTQENQPSQLPKPRFPRVSSLPVDTASNVLL